MFASKLHIPGPVSGFRPSDPSCPGAAFRNTSFPLASASAVRVQNDASDEATLAHDGSGTLWYCCEKKLPKASPFFNGQTTFPSRGNDPTMSGIPALVMVVPFIREAVSPPTSVVKP